MSTPNLWRILRWAPSGSLFEDVSRVVFAAQNWVEARDLARAYLKLDPPNDSEWCRVLDADLPSFRTLVGQRGGEMWAVELRGGKHPPAFLVGVVVNTSQSNGGTDG